MIINQMINEMSEQANLNMSFIYLISLEYYLDDLNL